MGDEERSVPPTAADVMGAISVGLAEVATGNVWRDGIVVDRTSKLDQEGVRLTSGDGHEDTFIELDSIARLALLAVLEEQLGLEIPEDVKLREVTTLGELADAIAEGLQAVMTGGV